MDWKDNVDSGIKDHLKIQIEESLRHSAYKNSKNPSAAQLWVAVANLSKQIFDLNLKLNYLESALRDVLKIKTRSVKTTKKKKVKRGRRKRK